jgi:hypothetical protein
MMCIAQITSAGQFNMNPVYKRFSGTARTELDHIIALWMGMNADERWTKSRYLHINPRSGSIIISRYRDRTQPSDEHQEIGRLSGPVVSVFTRDMLPVISHGACPVDQDAQIASLLVLASEGEGLYARILQEILIHLTT